MTECAPGCGRCCDPVVLDFPVADMTGPSAPFAREHWTQIGVGFGPDGQTLYRVRCDAFDPRTRLCAAHDQRPPICAGYPYYGDGPSGLADTRSLAPGCEFTRDHFRMLPIEPVVR